jgi:hypothetical protein
MKGEEITITGVGNHFYCISEIKKSKNPGNCLKEVRFHVIVG